MPAHSSGEADPCLIDCDHGCGGSLPRQRCPMRVVGWLLIILSLLVFVFLGLFCLSILAISLAHGTRNWAIDFLGVPFVTTTLIGSVVLFLVALPLAEIIKPSAIRYFLTGLLGLCGWAILLTTVFPVAPPPDCAPFILLVMLLTSPVCFLMGARLSLKEAGTGSKALRRANVVGLGISVGLVLKFLQGFLRFVVFAD